MIYTLTPNGEYMYVMRKPTKAERNHYIRNGYTPPELERESDRDAYMYARGETKPNYPMPAIPLKITWGGTFWRWLTIVELSTPFNRVIRYWEDSPNGFTQYH